MGTSLSKILAVSSVVMVELKHVTMTRPNKIQDKQTSRPNSVLGIRSPYLKYEKSSFRCPQWSAKADFRLLIYATETTGKTQLALAS